MFIASGPTRSFQTHPCYFMFATLMDSDLDIELVTLQTSSARVISGSITSSLYRLKDTQGTHGGFFVFPDMSVKVEGLYRLKFTMYEIIG